MPTPDRCAAQIYELEATVGDFSGDQELLNNRMWGPINLSSHTTLLHMHAAAKGIHQ